jgi:hypothetical protein
MALTLSDLPARVLRELKVLSADDSPDNTDQTDILEKYEWWRQEAERDWNIEWDENDDIPDGAEQAVVWLMANRVAVSYNKPYSDQRQEMGEDLLKKAVRLPWSGEPATNDHF